MIVVKVLLKVEAIVVQVKVFVAITVVLVAMFSWNPLFHCIDQARGFAFVNYNPHKSSLMYPIVFTLVFLAVGLLAEFFTRKRVSLSWGAR